MTSLSSLSRSLVVGRDTSFGLSDSTYPVNQLIVTM